MFCSDDKKVNDWGLRVLFASLLYSWMNLPDTIHNNSQPISSLTHV